MEFTSGKMCQDTIENLAGDDTECNKVLTCGLLANLKASATIDIVLNVTAFYPLEICESLANQFFNGSKFTTQFAIFIITEFTFLGHLGNLIYLEATIVIAYIFLFVSVELNFYLEAAECNLCKT